MTGTCPICDGKVTVQNSAQISEIIACSECQNKLEVKAIQETSMTLTQAPKVEEDWGE